MKHRIFACRTCRWGVLRVAGWVVLGLMEVVVVVAVVVGGVCVCEGGGAVSINN